ncbi:MAG: hypothetical protein M1132_13935 [Chloroflexi bacterium]|nr:hypothetical protein [Chloroflexota bacterium]
MGNMNAKSGRSPWEIAAVAGLVATAIGPILAMVLDRAFAVPGLIFIVFPLVMAGLVLTRNRWLISLVAVLSAVLLAAALRSPIVQARLVNLQTGYSVVAWLQTLGPAIAIVATLGVLVQGVLAPPPRSASQS